MQRANVLRIGAADIHNEDILPFENVRGREIVRYLDRHEVTPSIL